MKIYHLLLVLQPLLLLATPTTPSNLTLTAGNSSVDISWQDNAKNETGYKIFRDGALIATVGKSATSYHDSGLTPDTDYAYTLKATDDTPQGVMVNSTKETFGINGEPLTFNTYNYRADNDKKDWLAIFKKGAALNRDNLLGWSWANGIQNGTITISPYHALPLGEYQIASFYNNSYNPESISYFNIHDKLVLQTTKDIYDINEHTVVVDMTNTYQRDNNKDIIAIFKADDEAILGNELGKIYTNNTNQVGGDGGNGLVYGKVTISNINFPTAGLYKAVHVFDSQLEDGTTYFRVVDDNNPGNVNYGTRPNVNVIKENDSNEIKIYYRENTQNAPVVVFLPGYNTQNEAALNNYTPLLDFVAAQGYYVIAVSHIYYNFPRVKNLVEAAHNSNKADTSRLTLMGHSLGAANAYYFLRDLKLENYGLTKSSIISLDGWFAFNMTPDDLKNFNSKALVMAFGGADGIYDENKNPPHLQDPKINYAAYSMLGGDEKAFLHIEADNTHGYPYSQGQFLDKIELLRPIHAFLDYSLKGDAAAKDIALRDNHQDVLNYITNEQGNTNYDYPCLYPWNDKYDYCNLNNILSNDIWQH